MKVWQLTSPAPMEQAPLHLGDVPIPAARAGEVVIRVKACGLCHTDLHIVEGDLPLVRSPLIPGHQIVGSVDAVGSGVASVQPGERVGVPWLNTTCMECAHCREGRENLCDYARFTGYHVDGGYAEYVVVRAESAYALPAGFQDAHAAPLLCAGVIGYRALRLSGIAPGGCIGLYGFGASAHIAIQVLRYWKCTVLVITRSGHHQELARELGAAWAGSAGENLPHELDAAVIFAPAGELVPIALKSVRKGGTVALAGIHMSPIPAMEYATVYGERTLRSVANSTRDDVRGLLALASEIPIGTEVETFPFSIVNEALVKLKRSEIRGSAVLVME